VSPELMARYFRRVDDDHLQIDTSLRRRACFTRLNVQEWRTAPLGGFDVIFCQNLLIYFGRAHRHSIADALAERLRPGGMLIFGGGELPAWSHPELERISYPNTLAYRRRNIMQDSRTDG
jgi:chemotaxis methyl-accepting protein methylase